MVCAARHRQLFHLKLVLATVAGLALSTLPAPHAQAATPAPSGNHENGSVHVRTSGAWTTVSSKHASGGTFTSLGAPGHADVSFRGTGIEWVARTNAAGGLIDVYVDGARKRTVDLYSAQTKYRQVAFRLTGLPDRAHTLRLVRTGKRNPSSIGRNLLLDAVRVLDSRAPATPTTVTRTVQRGGVRISWAAGTDRDLAQYRVYRQLSAGGQLTLVGEVRAPSASLLDVGLPSSTAYSYRVTAVDSSGNASAPTRPVTLTTPAPAPTTRNRYAACPAATVTVSDSARLAAALDEATAGAVIRMLPGSYRGQFRLAVQASAAAPVWVCGPRTAVIDGGAPTARGGIRVQSSSHVVLAGMTIRNSLKGVAVWDSRHVTVADTRVEDIGDEAIHLLDFTTDSTVVANSISNTGLVNPQYGEGVYLGTAENNWCAFSRCLPDRSDRNSVLHNTFSRITAEPIEAKVATTGGVISGNTINGLGMRPTSYALIYVKGNDYVVAGNRGTNSSIDGILVIQRQSGWGRDNVVFGNAFYGSIPGYAVHVASAGLGNIVGCGTVAPSSAIAATNTSCQP